jgi:hypothetical protein
MKLPDGRCASGPFFRSAMTCSMTAWRPVVGLGVEHRQWRVGEHRVVSPDREQLALLIRDDVVRVGVADPAHDQPPGVVSVWGGWLPMRETLPLLPVVDALGELSRLDGGKLLDAALAVTPRYVRMAMERLLP